MVPSTSVIPELFHLYFSVRTTTQVFHLVICCLYSVISRDVATCERLEKVLGADKGNVEVLSCRRLQCILKDQFLPLVPSLGVHPYSLAWDTLCRVSAAVSTAAGSQRGGLQNICPQARSKV